jgi:CHAT domain-containing protein
LLKPIAADLEVLGARTLLVYLDGNLRYLPVAALHDGRRYLAERYAVAVYTSATRDKLALPNQDRWQVAALGVSKETAGFRALPSVVAELDAIVKESGDDAIGVLPGVLHLDEAFTRANLSAALRRRFAVVHMASHFKFSLDEDSFLLLGNGETLAIDELNPVQFPMSHVDLLTLSACETAVGGTSARGQEFESFSVLAQKQGASAVIATLWSVDDPSTGAFMRTFYDLHERYHLSKARALQLTQQLFISGVVVAPDGARIELRGGEHVDGFTPASDELRYSHPFYWAPFVLSGNWL